MSNGLIKEKLFSVEKITICDNSNLVFRGTPVFGVLEDDGVHITRKGVFILNNNFRICLHGSSSGTVAKNLVNIPVVMDIDLCSIVAWIFEGDLLANGVLVITLIDNRQ